MKQLLTLIFTFLVFSLSAQVTHIHCGGLIDGVQNRTMKEMTIVVEGNVIKEVREGYSTPLPEEGLIDLRDHTVMPGLMDMHVHLETEINKASYTERFTLNEADIAFRSAVNAETTLMAGFTTVRDLGGSGVNVSLREAIRKGLVDGPRVFTVCKAIAITGGHADPTNGYKKSLLPSHIGPTMGVADGPDACRQAVRQQVKNGADCIKITATGGVLSVARDGFAPQFREEEIRAIVETANDFGIHVAAHAHGAEGMKRAIRAGVTSIEHGTLMDDEAISLMKENGTWYVPTITAGESVHDSAMVPNYYPEVITPKALFIGPKIKSTFNKAYLAGVKIAFGTDAGVFPHGKNAIEFELMVQQGMSPMEAIQCATSKAAEMLGQSEKLGSIQAGRMADIVAVQGNPIQDISLLKNIAFVMKDGKVYKNQ